MVSLTETPGFQFRSYAYGIPVSCSLVSISQSYIIKRQILEEYLSAK